MKRNADNPAAPIYLDTPICGEGLTKREWFAGQALAGLVARGLHESPDFAAKQAVRLADALLDRLAVPHLAELVKESDGLVPPPF